MMLKQSLTLAETAIPKLSEFADRRWFKVLR
jgi:hypothetical protein